MSKLNQQQVIDTAILAGKIMTESGAEAYRVEDTMQRIAQNSGYHQTESYVTATAIFLTFTNTSHTTFIQARNRSMNIWKIDQTNSLSRKYAQGEISLGELEVALHEVEMSQPMFTLSHRVLAAGLTSAVLMLLFGGDVRDFILTALIGMIGYFVASYVNQKTKVKNIGELVAVLVLGLSSIIFWKCQIIVNIDTLIIGSIMPLVPGLALTAGLTDLTEGHMLTGTVRLVEAVMLLGIIGAGVACAFKWFW